MAVGYSYEFHVGDEIIPNYSSYLCHWDGGVKYLFETRAHFKVRGWFDSAETIIDEETYATAGWKDCDEKYLEVWMGRRLQDYGMSHEKLQEVVDNTLAFAKQSRRNSKNPLTAVVLDIDICTMQQEGEPMNLTLERAVRRQFLYPLTLCPVNAAAPWKNGTREEQLVHHKLLLFLREKLQTITVEDVKDSRMEICPICCLNPTTGAQISMLQCGHGFHSYCITQWLKNKDSCPMCRRLAHSEPVSYE